MSPALICIAWDHKRLSSGPCKPRRPLSMVQPNGFAKLLSMCHTRNPPQTPSSALEVSRAGSERKCARALNGRRKGSEMVWHLVCLYACYTGQKLWRERYTHDRCQCELSDTALCSAGVQEHISGLAETSRCKCRTVGRAGKGRARQYIDVCTSRETLKTDLEWR